jgi:hypothetical protein
LLDHRRDALARLLVAVGVNPDLALTGRAPVVRGANLSG